MAIKHLTIRFNMDNPKHQITWDYLHNIDKEKYKSFSETAITAIASYFERQEQLGNDPYFETRQKEDEFVNKIVEGVEQKIEKALPAFLLSCLASYAVPQNTIIADKPEETDAKAPEIDWSFVGDE